MTALQLTYNDILTLLSIIAVGMLIILLYHLIFVSVSLRRTASRLDELSKDVETIILKPIGAIDYVIDMFLGVVEGMKGEKKGKHHKKGHHIDVE
jgi:hypothetical protein